MKTLRDFLLFLEKEEARAPRHFSLEQLKGLSTFREILIYTDTNLGKPNSEGHFRKVWDVGEGMVLKLAKLRSYASQNMQEKKNLDCLGTDFAVKLIDYDQANFFWLLEEKLTPVSSEEFLSYFNSKLNQKFYNSMDVILLFTMLTQERAEFPEYRKIEQNLSETNQWFREFKSAIQSCNVPSWDFRPANWGRRTSSGDLVLLDVGF